MNSVFVCKFVSQFMNVAIVFIIIGISIIFNQKCSVVVKILIHLCDCGFDYKFIWHVNSTVFIFLEYKEEHVLLRYIFLWLELSKVGVIYFIINVGSLFQTLLYYIHYTKYAKNTYFHLFQHIIMSSCVNKTCQKHRNINIVHITIANKQSIWITTRINLLWMSKTPNGRKKRFTDRRICIIHNGKRIGLLIAEKLSKNRYIKALEKCRDIFRGKNCKSIISLC